MQVLMAMQAAAVVAGPAPQGPQSAAGAGLEATSDAICLLRLQHTVQVSVI